LGNHAAGAMNRRKHYLQRFRLPHDLWIEHQRLQPAHIRLIYFGADRGDFSALFWRQRRERFTDNRVYLRDDAAGVRLHYLSAITEVNLVAIVMWRVMARGDDDPGGRVEISH